MIDGQINPHHTSAASQRGTLPGRPHTSGDRASTYAGAVPIVVEDNPPPLTVAASLVAVQGMVLVALSALELTSISPERVSMGVSTAVFFLLYGIALLACAWGLTRRAAWSRGPVLITQLIQLGLAWNLRDVPLPAVVLAVTAVVALAGMLHPTTVEVLNRAEEPEA